MNDAQLNTLDRETRHPTTGNEMKKKPKNSITNSNGLISLFSSLNINEKLLEKHINSFTYNWVSLGFE